MTEVSGACPFNNYASITCYCYGDKIAIKIKTDTVSAIAEAEVKWRRQIFNNWNPQCASQRTILSPGGGGEGEVHRSELASLGSEPGVGI